MTNAVMTQSATKTWINQFLARRGLERPNCEPLYSYQVTQSEFDSLPIAIRSAAAHFNSSAYRDHWCGAVCLFVAEQYRREYERDWSWRSIEQKLGVKFDTNCRTVIAERGLKFWGREIVRENGRADLLGSMFSEGGLSWALIRHEPHGFSRAVGAGLKQYFEYQHQGTPLSQLMAQYAKTFPVSFRTAEKCQLLAEIVEALMKLANTHDLFDTTHPVEKLNLVQPGWQSTLPLPITELNSEALVNTWLGDAATAHHADQTRRMLVNAFLAKTRWLMQSLASLTRRK